MLASNTHTESHMEMPADILSDYFDRLWRSKETLKIKRVIERVKFPLHEHVHAFVAARNHTINKLLEIGPGHGWDAEKFRRTVSVYTGIELSQESCHALRSGMGLPMVRALAENLPLIPGSLDCVYMSTTLMHLQKRQAIEDISRILKTDGYFIFIEPFTRHPLVRIYQKFKYRDLPYEYLSYEDLTFINSRLQCVEERFFGLLFIADTRLNFLNNLLMKIDTWLFQFAFFRRFAWLYLGIYQNQGHEKCGRNTPGKPPV